MIEQIRIKNYQSHKSTQLKFNPGVNSIIGRSDSGKTSILRALFWVIENRPLGDAFVSHWALDERRRQRENVSVLVITNGKKVKRLRAVGLNTYKIGEKLLEAIRTDVPEEVKQAFNLTEVNLQKQMDAPFLLSESAGEVARFFNRIIRLDIIDSFLTSVESKKRQAKGKKGEFVSKIIDIQKNLKKLDWIDGADRLILKAERVEDKIEKMENSRANLIDSIEQHETYADVLSDIPDIDKAEKLLNEWSKTNASKDKLSLILSDLTFSIRRWTEASELIEKELPDLEQAQNLLKKYEELDDKRSQVEDSLEELQNATQKWEILQEQTASASNEITRLEKQLPERCPTCGQLLKKDKEV